MLFDSVVAANVAVNRSASSNSNSVKSAPVSSVPGDGILLTPTAPHLQF